MYAFLKATVVSKLDFGGIKGNFPLFNTTSYGAPVWKKQIENEKRFDATRTNGRKMYESGIIKKHSNLCLFLKSGECHGVPNWKLLVIAGYICHPWITDFQSAMWSNAFSLKSWIYQNLNFDEPDGPSLGILDLWKHAACLAQKREFGGLFNPQESNVSCNKEEGLVSGEHIFLNSTSLLPVRESVHGCPVAMQKIGKGPQRLSLGKIYQSTNQLVASICGWKGATC